MVDNRLSTINHVGRMVMKVFCFRQLKNDVDLEESDWSYEFKPEWVQRLHEDVQYTEITSFIIKNKFQKGEKLIWTDPDYGPRDCTFHCWNEGGGICIRLEGEGVTSSHQTPGADGGYYFVTAESFLQVSHK